MNPLSPTLVCFAVRQEADPFERLVGGSDRLRVLFTGMGQRNAEKAIRRALEQAATGLVLSCGFAGSLKPEWSPGRVLFEVEGEPGLESRLRAAGAQAGLFHCAERVVATASEKRQLLETTGADAVEMESGVIRAVCRERQVRCATVRVILDGAEEDLPLDFNQILNTQYRIDGFKLAALLVRSPRTIGALLRFRKEAVEAAERLARVLAEVIVAG